MGASRHKKGRFLTQHPFCCFCGGTKPTASIDHVPSRACFLGRHGPDTFEFPACDDCQNATRKDEIAFSFMVRVVDFNRDNYDQVEIQKAIAGMANNLGHLLPNPYLDGVQKRRKLTELGLRKPMDMTNEDIPMVAMPAALNVPIRRYSMKIVSALFYREKGRALPLDYVTVLKWGQLGLPSDRAMLKTFVQITPLLVRGARPNLNFGDRFGYRCNKAEDPDVFAAAIQFGKGLFILAMIAPLDFAMQTIATEAWRPVSEELAIVAGQR